MSVYHKADLGELIQWVIPTHGRARHQIRDWSESGRSRELLTPGTMTHAGRAASSPEIFGHFWPSVWPTSCSNFDLGPSPLDSTEKNLSYQSLWFWSAVFLSVHHIQSREKWEWHGQDGGGIPVLSSIHPKQGRGQLGAVRITSLNPNFNWSHFRLPPGRIRRMTGWVAVSRILWRMRTAPIVPPARHISLNSSRTPCATCVKLKEREENIDVEEREKERGRGSNLTVAALWPARLPRCWSLRPLSRFKGIGIVASFRATFGLTRSIGGWEEGERRERNKWRGSQDELAKDNKENGSWTNSVKRQDR